MDKNKQKENALTINEMFSDVITQCENVIKEVFGNIMTESEKENKPEEKEDTPCCAGCKTEEHECCCDNCSCECCKDSDGCNEECCCGCCCDIAEAEPETPQPRSEEDIKSLYEMVADEINASQADNKCIAEQLYTRHYNTWAQMVAKDKKEEEDNERYALVDSITDEVVIMFKKILSNTLNPHDTIYYEIIPGTNNFDYYITFGGGFDSTDNKPYVKVCFDVAQAVSDNLVDLFNMPSFCPEELGATLAEKLGFNEEKAECYDNGEEIQYKFYYF